MLKLFTVVLLHFCYTATAQSIEGKWVTVDDETNEETSVVEIKHTNGKYVGTILQIFPAPGEEKDPSCTECPSDDPRYGKKIIGMDIIRNMIRDGDAYSQGDILDPRNGRVYRCKLWIEDQNLKVRGYWGPFYRTQTWKRAK